MKVKIYVDEKPRVDYKLPVINSHCPRAGNDQYNLILTSGY